jgi:NADPH-dependent curcumin reductase CurA
VPRQIVLAARRGFIIVGAFIDLLRGVNTGKMLVRL